MCHMILAQAQQGGLLLDKDTLYERAEFAGVTDALEEIWSAED